MALKHLNAQIGLTLHAQIMAATPFAVALAAGSGLKAREYAASDAAILSAAGGTLAAGRYAAMICVGSAGSASSADEVVGLDDLIWSGSARVTEVADFHASNVPDVNVVEIGGNDHAADNLELYFDNDGDECSTIVDDAAFPGQVQLDLTQAVPTANTGNTIGDCLNAARAQGFGKWVLNSGTRIVSYYAPDGTTVVHSFLIGPNLTQPLTRTPQ